MLAQTFDWIGCATERASETVSYNLYQLSKSIIIIIGILILQNLYK